jgi:hypothetical protein
LILIGLLHVLTCQLNMLLSREYIIANDVQLFALPLRHISDIIHDAIHLHNRLLEL